MSDVTPFKVEPPYHLLVDGVPEVGDIVTPSAGFFDRMQFGKAYLVTRVVGGEPRFFDDTNLERKPFWPHDKLRLVKRGTEEFDRFTRPASVAGEGAGSLLRDNQRLLDLVRQQRMELHDADLITDQEYADLAQVDGAVERLESYDAVRGQLAAEQKKVEEIRTLALSNHEDFYIVAMLQKLLFGRPQPAPSADAGEVVEPGEWYRNSNEIYFGDGRHGQISSVAFASTLVAAHNSQLEAVRKSIVPCERCAELEKRPTMQMVIDAVQGELSEAGTDTKTRELLNKCAVNIIEEIRAAQRLEKITPPNSVLLEMVRKSQSQPVPAEPSAKSELPEKVRQVCTCTDGCNTPCKGECGCEECKDSYQDYLSSREE